MCRQDVHDPGRLHARADGERERFAERLPIDHQRHVDGEFHHRAGADRPAMLDPATELIKNWLGARRVRSLRAHQADQLALPRAGPVEPPTGHSTNLPRLGANLLAERDLGPRLDRAHLDEQPALTSPASRPSAPL